MAEELTYPKVSATQGLLNDIITRYLFGEVTEEEREFVQQKCSGVQVCAIGMRHLDKKLDGIRCNAHSLLGNL